MPWPCSFGSNSVPKEAVLEEAAKGILVQRRPVPKEATHAPHPPLLILEENAQKLMIQAHDMMTQSQLKADLAKNVHKLAENLNLAIPEYQGAATAAAIHVLATWSGLQVYCVLMFLKRFSSVDASSPLRGRMRPQGACIVLLQAPKSPKSPKQRGLSGAWKRNLKFSPKSGLLRSGTNDGIVFF